MKNRLTYKSLVWYMCLVMLSTFSIAGSLSTGTAQETSAPATLTQALSGGSGYSPALRADGTLYAWGDNRHGQLGDGTTTGWHRPDQVFTAVSTTTPTPATASNPPPSPQARVLRGGSMQGTDLGLTSLNASVTTFAGSFEIGSADGTGTAARFDEPAGITTDGTNLYIADFGNHRIRKIVIATGVVTTLAGSGAAASADGIGTAASFFHPIGITTDGTNLYVSEWAGNRIRKIVIATGAVTTLAGSGALGFADGIGTWAMFRRPSGITTDGINLYVVDHLNNRIRRIVISTGVVTTLAGSDAIGSADGTGTAASFYWPRGITTDGTNLYVADSWNNRIRRIVIATGVVTTLAGSTWGFADGTGTEARFHFPSWLTTDGINLYVADHNNNRIRRIVIATGNVTTIAGSIGSFRDGIGTAAWFNRPGGITTDGYSLYVADTGNSRIRRISPIVAGLTVTLPNGGENWPVGSTQNITWSTAGVTGNVHIQISRDGGSTWTDIFANTANDGSEPWTVTAPATTTARIRITSIATPAVSDVSDANFTISVVTAVGDPLEQLFRIFPNPATDVLNIEWKGTDRAEMEIVSAKGLVVLRKTIDSKSNQVDISQLPEGIYILKLVAGNNAGRAIFIRQGR